MISKDYLLYDTYVNARIAMYIAKAHKECGKFKSDSSAFIYSWLKNGIKDGRISKSIKGEIKRVLLGAKTSHWCLDELTDETIKRLTRLNKTKGPEVLTSLITKLTENGWKCKKANQKDFPYNGLDLEFVFISEQINNAFSGYSFKDGSTLTFFVYGNYKKARQIAMNCNLILDPIATRVTMDGIRETVLSLSHVL